MTEKLNLTGVWQGLYSYPQALAPVAFTATLLDSGWLSGSIHEIAIGDDDLPVQVSPPSWAAARAGRSSSTRPMTARRAGRTPWAMPAR